MAAVSTRAVDAPAALGPPARCGELLCQRDSYTRSLTTHVVSCVPHAPAAPAGAPKAPKKKGGAKAEAPLWEVVLGDTVLFPEGGGQPTDRGTVGGVEVVRVDNIGGACVHLAAAPLTPGDSARVEVDWGRRWDHTTQHSAQHVLSALALRDHGLETTAWALGAETSFVEFGAKTLSPEQLRDLEVAANAAIRADHAVRASWHAPADVASGTVPGLRKSSRALPASVEGPVRVITYDGIDTNLCCGTHVASTGHLQAIKLLRVEGAKGACRVHYLAGDRVIDALGAAWSRQAALGTMLAAPAEKLVPAVDELIRRGAERDRMLKTATAEIVELTVDKLLRADAERLLNPPTPVARVLRCHRQKADADFMKALATALDARGALTDHVLLATGGEGEDGIYLLASADTALVAPNSALANAVGVALGGRGGGARGRYQGKASRLSALDEACAAAEAVMNGPTTVAAD